MRVRPGARGCAGGRARIRKRKWPESPVYRGFLLYYILKSQRGFTVPRYLCGKSALERAVFRVAGLEMAASYGASVDTAT